jgi:hypothetical protein
LGFEFLHRVQKTSIITGFVFFIFITLYLGPTTGLAWLLGCTWMLLNILATTLLVRLLCADGKRQKLRLAGALLIKLPALYAAGLLLLRNGGLPISGLLAGFLWPLSVITLKALGRFALRMDSAPGPAADARD